MTGQRVRRWGIGLVVTLALVGPGLLYADATLLAGAAIPLAYVLYGTLSRLPRDVELSVHRELTPETPTPGAPVTVRLTVENTGDAVLSDVRLIDGVPDELAVSDGSPRLVVSLSPGESRTVTYSVVAKRGSHTFDLPAARIRSLAGSHRHTTEIEVQGDSQFDCVTAVEDAPLQETTTRHTGPVPTDSGGSGLEFHATREYKHGDPVSRIDWHHVAKTGEFKTVQFREERASRTILVLDARPVCRVTPEAGHPTGVELVAYVGERIYDSLNQAGVNTSVAAVGLDERNSDDRNLAGLLGADGIAWVDPGRESGHRANPNSVFTAVRQVADEGGARLDLSPPRPGLSRSGDGAVDSPRTHATERGPGGGRRDDSRTARADGGDRTERLLARLPPDAQVLLCSPLLDNWPVPLAGTLASRGYNHLVVSPDVVGGANPGQRVAAANRRLRIRAIERSGASTVDWTATEPIEHALWRSLPQLLAQR